MANVAPRQRRLPPPNGSQVVGPSVAPSIRSGSNRSGWGYCSGLLCTSPMPGAVVAVSVDDGAKVEAGTLVVTVEAMKMEHALAAPVDGVVELLVAVGDQVKVGQPLARIIVSGNAIPEAKDSAS